MDTDGDITVLIEALVHFVACHLQRVDISALHDAACRYEVRAFLLVDDGAKYAAERYNARCNDFLHLVDNAVQRVDVAVANVYRAVAVHVNAVGALYHMHGQLTAVHVVHRHLGVVVRREGICLVETFLAAVDDTVVHDDVANGVKLCGVGEGVPRGRCYDFLFHQLLEVLLYSVVCRREHSVIAAGRKQLSHGGLADETDWHYLQQLHVFRVVVVLLEIRKDGLFLEDVTRRFINILLTCAQEQRYEQC